MPLQVLRPDTPAGGVMVAGAAAPLIDRLEDHPRWCEACAGLLEGIAVDRWQGVFSNASPAEVLTGPLLQGCEELVEPCAAVLTQPAGFRLSSLSPVIANGAARPRARCGLCLPDAVQLPSALHSGVVALATPDRDFAGCGDLPSLCAPL